MNTQNPTSDRSIVYDRETKDYACYVDGTLIGFAKSYHDGEIVCDRYIFDELAHTEPVAFVASRDEAHRQERWANIFNHIDALPEPQKTEAITFAFATMENIIGQRDQRAAA